MIVFSARSKLLVSVLNTALPWFSINLYELNEMSSDALIIKSCELAVAIF